MTTAVNAGRSRAAWWAARLAAAAGTLAVLVWSLGTGPFLDGLRAVDGAALAAACGLAVLTTVCCAWRWRIVARGLGVDPQDGHRLGVALGRGPGDDPSTGRVAHQLLQLAQRLEPDGFGQPRAPVVDQDHLDAPGASLLDGVRHPL